MSSPSVWILNHYAGSMYEAEGGRHYWFAKELRKRGYRATVFCANSRYEQTGEFFELDGLYAEKETSEGVPFVFVRSVPYDQNGIKRAHDMVAFYRNVKKVAREYKDNNEKPDIILASSVHPLTLLAGEHLAKNWDIPCICEVRDLWPEAFFYAGAITKKSVIGKALMAGERFIYRRADALIFLKEGDASYLVENAWDVESGGDIDIKKCHYINNGIDYESYSTQIESERFDDEDLDSDKKIVVYAGTIRPTNDVGNIITAAKFLKDRDDILILIYGEGSERPALEQRIGEEGLTNVKFKGFVEKRKIPYILSKSTVNLLNYSAKGYNWSRGNSSNKLFEYMAAGKPVISSVKMAYNPVDKYGCGISLDEATPKELAASICTICDMDDGTYDVMCKQAIKGAMDFDFRVLTDKLEEVIAEVFRA